MEKFNSNKKEKRKPFRVTLLNFAQLRSCVTSIIRMYLCHKASDTQRGNSAWDAVRNGLSDTIFRLQPKSTKHVPVSGVFSVITVGLSVKIKLNLN